MKTIFFGNYWQSNDKEKEPIEWLVLKEDEDKMYLLSKYCLDCVPYNIEKASSWEKSYLRNWLNSTFINNAFSVDEQNLIILSNIKSNAWYGSWYEENPLLDSIGTACQDKVFVPSIYEAIVFFGSEEWHDIDSEQKRIARPTNYAYEKGDCWVSCLEYSPLKYLSVYDGRVNPADSYWHIGYSLFPKKEPFGADTTEKRWASSWYLRSPDNDVVEVCVDGSIHDDFLISYKHTAVRPAMWVKKDK